MDNVVSIMVYEDDYSEGDADYNSKKAADKINNH